MGMLMGRMKSPCESHSNAMAMAAARVGQLIT